MLGAMATLSGGLQSADRDPPSTPTSGAHIFMSRFRAPSVSTALMLAAFTPLLAGCDDANTAAASDPGAVPEVGIVTVEQQARSIVRELPGRIAPTRVSDVRPRVSGIVVKRMFKQGSEVK